MNVLGFRADSRPPVTFTQQSVLKVLSDARNLFRTRGFSPEQTRVQLARRGLALSVQMVEITLAELESRGLATRLSNGNWREARHA